jgi:hypothetical protein
MPAKELSPITQKITGKSKSDTILEVDEETKKRTAIDEKLLANAKKSLTELSRITGLDAKDVAERMAWLLEDRGWMTERMEERYMLIELADLMSDAKERLKRAQDKDYGAIGKVVLGSFEQMAQRWDARRAIVDADIDKITARQAKLYGRTYDTALSTIFESLRVLHPEITDEEEYELKIEGLRAASEALGESVIE